MSKTLIARWMEHIHSQGSGTLLGLSGTLTRDTFRGSGCPDCGLSHDSKDWLVEGFREANKAERLKHRVVNKKSD